MNKLKEKKLVYQIRANQDDQAFAELYDHYVDDIFRFVYYKVSNQHLAEDLTSDVFLKTWKYVTDKENKEVNNFRALIYKIARGKVIDHYRTNKKKEQAPVKDMLEVTPSGEDVEKEAHKNFAHKKVLKHLDKLKENYKEVIVLRYLQELSTKEAAEVMDKSRSSIRVTLHRAMNKLEELLQDE